MRDEEKTREQLIAELVELRQRVAEFEAEREELREQQPPKIGEILMEMGYVTMTQLEICLQRQKEASEPGGRQRLLGEIMVECGVITAEQLLRGLAEQLKRLKLTRASTAAI
jgi:mevalonate kinase